MADAKKSSEEYPVMPLRNTVLFPQQVIPIYVGREKSLKLINDLSPQSKHIVVVAQEDGSIEDPDPSSCATTTICFRFGSSSSISFKLLSLPI